MLCLNVILIHGLLALIEALALLKSFSTAVALTSLLKGKGTALRGSTS